MNKVNLFISRAIEDLEQVERQEPRLSNIINELGKIKEHYAVDYSPKQVIFDFYTGSKEEKLDYDRN